MSRSLENTQNTAEDVPLTVSLKTLARRLDAHRSSVRRWLREAGVQPITVSGARNGAIRYLWSDVQAWLDSCAYID